MSPRYVLTNTFLQPELEIMAAMIFSKKIVNPKVYGGNEHSTTRNNVRHSAYFLDNYPKLGIQSINIHREAPVPPQEHIVGGEGIM